MFYIHQTSCISPLQTFNNVDLHTLHEPTDKKMLAIEPVYDSIPPGLLRRMGKAVRMGVGAAMPILKDIAKPNGIIIGTNNSGKEDCVKFLNQIIDYDEGILTPINFVQSTPNAVAAQIGLFTNNHGYNVSHLHLGLSFEGAMIDADMLLSENPTHSFLLGASDDISSYNYNFEEKMGWYKDGDLSINKLFEQKSQGYIPGEGAAMFLVNNNKDDAVAKLSAVHTLHHSDETVLKDKLEEFIKKYLPENETIDLLLTGENGDDRFDKYYTACKSLLNAGTIIARFKHTCGEYPTAIAVGVWLCCNILSTQSIPAHMIEKAAASSGYKNILIYNNYRFDQHSFILMSVPA